MDSTFLKSFIPELFFSIFILSNIIYYTFFINFYNINFPVLEKELFSHISFVLALLILLFSNSKIEGFLDTGLFINDTSIFQVKLLFILVSLFCLLSIFRSFSSQKLSFVEFYTFFNVLILSLLLIFSTLDFLTSYIVIETQSLCSCLMLAFKRNSAFSVEAGIKYFITSALASGIFVLGFCFIYLSTGSLNFNELNLFFSIPLENNSLVDYLNCVGVLFIVSALLFKIAAAPFHFWLPDVYEGSPLSTTIILSIIPKLPYFYFLIKIILIMGSESEELKLYLSFCGLLSIIIGSFLTMYQKKIKRLLICSSIAQMGFLLVSLQTFSFDSISNLYFFVIIYIITAIATWSSTSYFYFFFNRTQLFYFKVTPPLFLSMISIGKQGNIVLSTVFLILFFSNAGVPPVAGFLTKTLIINNLIGDLNMVIAAVSILASGFSVYLYLRLIKIIYVENNNNVWKSFKSISQFHANFNEIELLLILSICFFIIYFIYSPSYLLILSNKIVIGSLFF